MPMIRLEPHNVARNWYNRLVLPCHAIYWRYIELRLIVNHFLITLIVYKLGSLSSLEKNRLSYVEKASTIVGL